MTAAYRLKGLGWFAGCVVVTLGFYLVSLQVAAERGRLEQMDRKIVLAEREIRALDTEFDTRSNMIQLEKWNGDALALIVPTAAQFVKSEAQLASIDARGGVPQPLAGDAPIRTAAYVVPAITEVAPIQPQPVLQQASLQRASFQKPAPQPSVPVTVVTVAQNSAKPVVTKVALPAKPAVAAAAARKAQAVAMLDKSLLSDTTLGDLASAARAEGRRGR